MRYLCIIGLLALGLAPQPSCAEDQLEGVRPTPLTRPEMKKLLEDVKQRTPRIPLPELTNADTNSEDSRATSYESRVRRHYLNGIEASRSFGGPSNSTRGANPQAAEQAGQARGQAGGRSQDPLFSLSDELKVELFWIVSRINNCQYCIGHQESKLLRLGLSDDKIASLDFDWSSFDPASRAAFEFGKQFTLDPHLLDDASIKDLKKHFNENQILEMILSMAGNNSINRWKEAIGVPQNADGGGFSGPSSGRQESAANDNQPRGSYETPTSSAVEKKTSTIVVTSDQSHRANTCATVTRRPPIESMEYAEKKLVECMARAPRISLMDDATTRTNLPVMSNVSGALPSYARLLARFPTTGSSRLEGIQFAFEKGDLSPKLKWQLAWILARQDRAWYALGLAKSQLKSLGQTDSQIYALDGDWSAFSDKERSLFRVAKKLGTAPVILTAMDVKEAVDLVGPRDVVQTISFTTSMASFNRITEAAGLPLDKNVYQILSVGNQ